MKDVKSVMRNLMFAFIFGLLLFHVTDITGEDQTPSYKAFLGSVPPELLSNREHWSNSDQLITLAGLKGNLVWLQFNF